MPVFQHDYEFWFCFAPRSLGGATWFTDPYVRFAPAKFHPYRFGDFGAIFATYRQISPPITTKFFMLIVYV